MLYFVYPMKFKKFNYKGQHITEYTLLIILVVIGVIVMGPYVRRSWNAQMRGWEISAKDSFYDPFQKANPMNIDVGCDCSYNNGACVTETNFTMPNGDICAVRMKLYTLMCVPSGCTQSGNVPPYRCDGYSNDCCADFQPIYTCGSGSSPCCCGEFTPPSGAPSGCVYGQILRKAECGDPINPVYNYDWQHNTACMHACLDNSGGEVPPPAGVGFSGLCDGDDQQVPPLTKYRTVPTNGCTATYKCEVKCNTANGYIPRDDNGDGITDNCVCPTGYAPDESGACVPALRKKLDCVVYSGAFNVEIPECSGAFSEPLFYYQNSDCSTSPTLMTYYIEAWNRPNFCNQWTQGPTSGCGQGQFSEWKGRIKICCKPNVAPAVQFRCRVRSVQSRAFTSGGQSTGAQEPPCGYSHPSNIQCEERKWNTPPEAASAQGGALTNWLYFDRNVNNSKGGHRTKYCCNRTIGPAPDQMPSCTKIMVAGTSASYSSCDTLTPPSGDYYEELFHFCNNSDGNCGDKDIKYTICCTHSTMYYTPSSE